MPESVSVLALDMTLQQQGTNLVVPDLTTPASPFICMGILGSKYVPVRGKVLAERVASPPPA